MEEGVGRGRIRPALVSQTATAAAVGGAPLHAAALILALILGAVGLVALFGTFFYAQWQVRKGRSAEQRREGNRLIAVGLLFWVAAALLVNGAGRESGEDPAARLMLLIAGLLFVALAITVALWLRKALASLRARTVAREGRDVAGDPGVERIRSPSSAPRHRRRAVRR